MTSCKQNVSLKSTKQGAITGNLRQMNISSDDKARFDYFYLESIRQDEKGNYAAAFDLLSHCYDIIPNSSEVSFLFSKYYFTLKNNEKALQNIEKAAIAEPRNSFYQENLAHFYVEDKDYKKAIDTYERLLNEYPDRSDILENLLALYEQQEDYDNMIRTIDRLEVKEGVSEELSMNKFRIYLMQHKNEEAFNEMDNLARQYPNDLRYRVIIGDLQMQNGQEKEALETYDKVLKVEPENTLAQMSLLAYYKDKSLDSLYNPLLIKILESKNTSQENKLYLMRQVVSENEQNGGDSTKVLSLFRELLSEPQQDADMYTLCVAYMSMKKMPNDSISPILSNILKISPDNVAARLQLISYAWDKKKFAKVVNLCKPAIQYNPDEMVFYYYLGVAYYQLKKTDEALDTFQRGIGEINSQSSPEIVSDFYALMGDMLHEKKRYKEAYAAYDSCLQWKDDNLGCLNNYAYFLSVDGNNLDKAEQMSYKTIKKEPDNSTYLDTYAWILFEQKRYAEAKIYIEQAVLHDSDSSAVILEHAGDVCFLNKEVGTALEYWLKAQKAGSDSKTLFRKIKLKKYIRE